MLPAHPFYSFHFSPFLNQRHALGSVFDPANGDHARKEGHKGPIIIDIILLLNIFAKLDIFWPMLRINRIEMVKQVFQMS